MHEVWKDIERNESVKPRYRVQIELNPECGLPTALVFFQKVVITIAKFGITYFTSATIDEDGIIIASFQPTGAMKASVEAHNSETRKSNAAFVMMMENENAPHA